MASIEKLVKELIRSRYKSIAQFAQAAGLPPQTVYSALRNGLASTAASTLMPIAEALELDPQGILDGKLVKSPGRTVSVPLVTTISAGKPVEGLSLNDVFPIPDHVHALHPHGVLLRVSGESMNRVLPNGCFALVVPCREARSRRDIYAVDIGAGETTIKHVRYLDNGIELLPDSNDPTFKPQVYDYSDPGAYRVRVVGKVVWFTVPYSWSFGAAP